MKASLRTILVLAGAGLAASAATSTTSAAPHYNIGDYGRFGNGQVATLTDPPVDLWSNTSPNANLFDVGDMHAIRFTAKEAATFDRLYQTFSNASEGEMVTVRLIEDDGSGNPANGTVLRTSDSQAAVSGVQPLLITSVASPTPVTLTPNKTYFITTTVDNIGTGGFTANASAFSNDIRPHDRALDTTMATGRNTDGFWQPIGLDPAFYLRNGASTVVPALGQPNENFTYSSVYTRGGGFQQNGQLFTILDTEVPAGTELLIKQLSMSVFSFGPAVENLIVRIREADGTILGSATLTPSQTSSVFLKQILTLDTPALIEQGVPYLLTTELANPGTIAEHYLLLTAYTSPGAGAAGWGGTTQAYVIGSTNDWATYAPLAGFGDYDIIFSFQATVPEPGSAMAVIGIAGALVARRRMRRS